MSDLYRALNDHARGEVVLQESLFKVMDSAAIQHALGLLFVRQKKLPQAINYLRKVAESSPSNERYIHIYAIALHSTGGAEKAIKVLEQAYEEFPHSTDVINALVSINRELGKLDEASNLIKYYRSHYGKYFSAVCC